MWMCLLHREAVVNVGVHIINNVTFDICVLQYLILLSVVRTTDRKNRGKK